MKTPSKAPPRGEPAKAAHIHEWHPCEHCKQFGEHVKILSTGSYDIGEAKDWNHALSLCREHNSSLAELEHVKVASDELLAALKETVPAMERMDAMLLKITHSPKECEKGEIVRARAAIAKAEKEKSG